MTRERIGLLDVETTSVGVFLQSETGDTVHIPTANLKAVGELIVRAAYKAEFETRLAVAADPFIDRSTKCLSADGDRLLDTGR